MPSEYIVVFLLFCVTLIIRLVRIGLRLQRHESDAPPPMESVEPGTWDDV